MSPSDIQKDLVLKIAEGDTKAFKRFYDIYSGQVYHNTCFFIHSEEIREEAVSDVFLNLWLNREKLPGIVNLDAYLFILVRNTCYNYLDKESRIPKSTSGLTLEIQAEKTDPERNLITRELEQLINSSIEDLSERCRIIFLMSREENLKYREIAERLSISEKTVHVQMVKALKKLNEVIRKYFGTNL